MDLRPQPAHEADAGDLPQPFLEGGGPWQRAFDFEERVPRIFVVVGLDKPFAGIQIVLLGELVSADVREDLFQASARVDKCNGALVDDGDEHVEM
ncbi:MAG: hypothetical protein AAB919_01325 [Patescibacteria group bacterium]